MISTTKNNGLQQHPTNSLTAANQKINKKVQGIEKTQRMQSQIHPDIYIYCNSINLLVGRGGSGNTYKIICEIIKICMLDNNGGFTSFAIILDKPNDSTILESLHLIKDDLKIIQTDYEHAYDVLDEIMEGKVPTIR
jgi:hypothetical protein